MSDATTPPSLLAALFMRLTNQWRQRWPARLKQPRYALLSRVLPRSSRAIDDALPFHSSLFDYLRLRPYGTQLATPAVLVWLGFAWIIITLMATIEGVVWGFVGASIVPHDAAEWQPVVGLFMCCLLFAVIWIVDASFVMSERPSLRMGADEWQRQLQRKAQWRWAFGIIMRVGIVSISLYVTAPFLAKLIRADDIVHYHQYQVTQYYADRDAALQEQIRVQTAPIEQAFLGQETTLENQIAQLTAVMAARRDVHKQVEQEYAPELAVLRRELAAAQQRLGDELLGRNERREGYGPEAQRWEQRVQALTKQLATKQQEYESRRGVMDQAVEREQEQQLQQFTTALTELQREKQRRLDTMIKTVTAQQPPATPPQLTFAARSHILQALRLSPAERGVPHFETVEGFAQAALAILFLALIALKLFEPTAVRAYFSESLQFQYRKYQQGGLAEIPRFAPPTPPAPWLHPVEFAQLWQRYETAPELFFADDAALQRLREPAIQKQSQRAFEQALNTQRQAHLQQEVELAQQRRTFELTAYQEELQLRTAQLRTQLDDELTATREQRQQALYDELQRAREAWALEKMRMETALRERELKWQRQLETQREQAAAATQQYELRLMELQQAALEQQQRYERAQIAQQEQLANQRLQQRLSRLQQVYSQWSKQLTAERQLRVTQREALHQVLQEIQVNAAQMDQFTVQQAARTQRMMTLREQLSAELTGTVPAGLTQLWLRPEKGIDTTHHKALRQELNTLEQTSAAAQTQLVQFTAAAERLAARRVVLEEELGAADARVVATTTRLQLVTDRIEQLLV